MDWRAYYKEHTMTPEQAVGVIHDGDRVVFGHAVGEPIVFQRTMARMAEQFHNVEVAHMVYLGSGEYLQPGMESHFRHNALFVGGPARKPIAENRADYTPAFFSDVPRMFRDNTLPVDVFAFTCSPPDERGYVSLGLSCDYGAQAVKSAKTVIAEVNPNMPRTYGESFVHVSEIDGFLCSWEPLPSPRRRKSARKTVQSANISLNSCVMVTACSWASVRCRMRSARSSATSTTLVCIPR